MRIDHYHKNIFVVVGMIVFFKVTGTEMDMPLFVSLLGATFIACIASSFNYMINEYLDAKSDSFHPKKKSRPIPSGEINVKILFVMCSCILLGTLLLSYYFYSFAFFISLCVFYFFSILYNVPPVRFKDHAFVDVLVESANTPIRICLGWYATGTLLIPKFTVLATVWCLGGFLMTAKRYAEHRFILNESDRVDYRKSYKSYTMEKLSTYMVFWLMLFNFSFGIFITRVEPATLVVSPFIIAFFIWFWWLSTKPDSIVKEPERIFEEKAFFLYSIFLLILFSVVFLFGSEIPFVNFLHHRYLSAP